MTFKVEPMKGGVLYQRYIDSVIEYYKVKGIEVNVVINKLTDANNHKCGEEVNITDNRDDTQILYFKITTYPCCCGASILSDFCYSFRTIDKDFKLVDDYVKLFNKIRTITLCQFMSSYYDHQIIYNGLKSCGWELIGEYENENSDNECFIIIKVKE